MKCMTCGKELKSPDEFYFEETVCYDIQQAEFDGKKFPEINSSKGDTVDCFIKTICCGAVVMHDDFENEFGVIEWY